MGRIGDWGEIMSGLIESATAILSASTRRLEAIANNVSNVSTPGFKRQLSFTEALAATTAEAPEAMLPRTRPDLSQGRLAETGNRLDLAISGAGFFQLRDGEALLYSRQGQFRLAEDGRVVTPQGYSLQQAEGGDLVLERGEVEILGDGNVLDAGRPVGRIGLFAPADGAALEAVSGSVFTIAGESVEVSGSELRQGMVEASNVSMGDEMVGMIAALRQAEGGARLVQLYDELIGRAVTTFGGTGR